VTEGECEGVYERCRRRGRGSVEMHGDREGACVSRVKGRCLCVPDESFEHVRHANGRQSNGTVPGLGSPSRHQSNPRSPVPAQSLGVRNLSQPHLTFTHRCTSLGIMSSPELERDEYDAVVIGTGLAESIAAAYVSSHSAWVFQLTTKSTGQSGQDGPPPRPERVLRRCSGLAHPGRTRRMVGTAWRLQHAGSWTFATLLACDGIGAHARAAGEQTEIRLVLVPHGIA
jgi:hypothetical protein